MALSSGDSTLRPRRQCSLSFKTTLILSVGLTSLAMLPGCSGCLKEDPVAKKKREEEEEKQKKKEKPKPNFEVDQDIRVQPSDGSINQNLVKPGHWIVGSQKMRANNYDFLAEVQAKAVDSNMHPIDIEHTNYQMDMSRPASLPKGQVKNIEMTYFIPRTLSRQKRQVSLHTRLLAGRGGSEMANNPPQPTIAMPDYQYKFLVLSSEPDQYGFLKRLDSIKPPSSSLDDFDRIEYYRVVLPKFKLRVPVPAHPLAWTSVAYVLWDDLPPTMLDPDQQEALVDWLHWGGQVIVSGPDSLDGLRGSFLEDYLPAQSAKAVELAPEKFEEMSLSWSIPESKNDEQPRPISIDAANPPVGIEFNRQPGASFVRGTGGLVVERQIGRGRIVVTAFRLSDRAIVNWGGRGGNFDGFFNSCILRRPRRKYSVSSEYFGPEISWTDYRDYTKDARLISTLRYFTRDMGHASAFGSSSTRLEKTARRDSQRVTNKDDWHFGGYQREALSGVAGWNDTGGTSSAARKSLLQAAGISVPKAGFVLRVLAVYLVVLVPINWGFFRLIGHVEWAWVAAPIIAIIGAGAVIRLAQLDIGFARSHKEIAVMEAYGGYHRAHLTRYLALYTSLSTSYDLTFEDNSALAQPFARDLSAQRKAYETVSTVSFRNDSNISLRGFKVRSNSTGMLHCEEMYNLGGSLNAVGDAAKGYQLENQSPLTLKDVGVIHQTEEGLQTAWIGTLRPKTTVPIPFRALEEGSQYFGQWQNSPTMTTLGEIPEGEVNMGPLVELATHKLRIREGEMRLIGWTDNKLPGVEIYPRASQRTIRTFALVHLKPGELPQPQRDVNAKSDVMDDNSDTDDDDDRLDEEKN